MKIAIGSDHVGFPLKDTVIATVREAGHEPIDLGTYNGEVPVDYPDYAEAVGRAVQRGEAERGILVCGSGVGACIAANKLKGIFACLCHDTYSARQGVQHDEMNVLCLGSRIIGPALAEELVSAFLNAEFDQVERHARRVEEIRAIEERNGLRA